MALRGYAKPAECTCTHMFTCGVCWRNRKPYLSLGFGEAPLQGRKTTP